MHFIENSGVSLIDQTEQPYRAIGVLRDITRSILADQEECVIGTQSEVSDNDKNIHVQTGGTFQDITERKNAEEVLKLKLK